MQKNIYVPLVIVLAVVIGGFFWWQQSQSAPAMMESDQSEQTESMGDQMEDQMMVATPLPASDEAMMEDTSMMAADADVNVELDLSNYKFVPNVIKAKAGDTVRVKISAVEGFHDFVIDELDVASKQISQGQSDVVEFTIPEDASGKEYEFYCSVGQHRQMGMVGTLMVE